MMQIKQNQPTFGAISLETDHIKRLSPDVGKKFLASTQKFGQLVPLTQGVNVQIIPQKGDVILIKTLPEAFEKLTAKQKIKFYMQEAKSLLTKGKSKIYSILPLKKGVNGKVEFSFNLLKKNVEKAAKSNKIFIA